jgi:hypothetical protein
MGTPIKRGILDVVRGGIAQQISKRAPCPVLLVSSKNGLSAVPIERQGRTGNDVRQALARSRAIHGGTHVRLKIHCGAQVPGCSG